MSKENELGKLKKGVRSAIGSSIDVMGNAFVDDEYRRRRKESKDELLKKYYEYRNSLQFEAAYALLDFISKYDDV